MRILNMIDEMFMLTMITTAQANLSVGSTIQAQFIYDHNAWRRVLYGHQFTYEELGSFGIERLTQESHEQSRQD